jgi:hypothetical protein
VPQLAQLGAPGQPARQPAHRRPDRDVHEHHLRQRADDEAHRPDAGGRQRDRHDEAEHGLERQQDALLALAEQPMAPFDRRRDRPVALGAKRIVDGVLPEWTIARQHRGHLGPHACEPARRDLSGRELDRKRKPVERAADACGIDQHARVLALGGREGAGTLEQQLDGVW